ncbi:MATH domain and coiled-coil domain-containing protein At3g58270 [Raphanus sativus]|uniref:MATH domain and coiled-coil domain-containing protein At3g58270 n=1 Tax=Raphanus sativus TaxID=3726 RepID=A0A6J0KAU2_RAPSA|nr:MATH domain and coiled-coil domain-containing protein At3g58270 [Raphanus sativus]
MTSHRVLMGEEQMEKRFSWVLKKFSSLQEERCYSRSFVVAGVNWRLAAYRKGDKNDGHLALFLEFADSESLPPGWARDVNFSLTLVTKAFGKSNLVMRTQQFFSDEIEGCGCDTFVPLTKLHEKSEGFLVNNKIIILAELHVLPASVVVVPEETVKKITEPLSCQADDESVGKSQRGASCEETEVTNLDDDGSSEEGSDNDDDDDGLFDEVTGEGSVSSKKDVYGDDASSPLSDDGGVDISLSNQSSALEEASHTVGNHGLKSNSVAAETEVSNDDAPKEDVGDEASSSFVFNDSGVINRTSLDQVKPLGDASQTVENGVITDTSVTEAAKETMDVNGFDVFSSQVESVRHIFRRHPDIALGFRPKNRQIKRAYMNELLSLIQLLCQSPEKLSEDDLSNADDTLADLIDIGFKLDWLKTKLNEVSEKKKKEQSIGARLLSMEEQLQKLKLMFLDLETQLQMEKAEALAARAPLSFSDVVC